MTQHFQAATPLLSMSSVSVGIRIKGDFYSVSSLSVLHGTAQTCILLHELPCHQFMTVFSGINIKLTQKIFLNRAQWLNWQCYKYYRAEVYFRLYFSMPDTVKPTVNIQTLLLLSRRVCSFFGAILNAVAHFK